MTKGKKRTAALLTAIMLCLCLAPGTAVSAIDDYPEEYRTAAKDALTDEWRFYNRECVSFVAWCLNSRNGIEFTNFTGGVKWSNGENWGKAAQTLGYTVDMNPAVGSVAWWTGAKGNHVAWVAAVEGDLVTIEEYNFDGHGNYHTRVIDVHEPSGYIHVADLEPGAVEPVDVHFEKQAAYTEGQFSDLPDEDWVLSSVADAVELGLMAGNGDGTFRPYGDVTLAEAVTMAARIHSIYHTGTESFVNGALRWYQTYLNYARENGIISYTLYISDAEQAVSRAVFAEILSRALPDEALRPINSVADGAIPDVPAAEEDAAHVYQLYRAGVLVGDEAGAFHPETSITRAEAAAIVSRMAESDSRLSVTLN